MTEGEPWSNAGRIQALSRTPVYHSTMRRSGARRVAVASMTLVAVMLAMACNARFARQYEYEEQIYLDTDGSASIIVNSSIAALVALRAAPLNVDPAARVDRDAVRAFYSSPVTRVTRVSDPGGGTAAGLSGSASRSTISAGFQRSRRLPGPSTASISVRRPRAVSTNRDGRRRRRGGRRMAG